MSDLSVDLQDLTSRLARLLGADVTGVEVLPGGISSLTFAAEVTGWGPVVVKVAPPGRRPVGNRDVLRQARLLDHLQGRGPLVPTVLATDGGRPEQGVPPLMVMSRVPGQSFEPAVDTSTAPPSPAVARQRVLAAARQLVAVQSVRPEGDPIGEPVVSLDAEVERWRRLFATGDDAERVAEADGLARDLASCTPDDAEPALVHGDYRLGNLLFDGAEVTAVIDWEIWSWGDRRLDLAWLGVQTHGLHRQTLVDPDAAHRAVIAALPDPADIVAAYVDAGGIPPGDLGWFAALADFKIGATLAILVKQNRRRPHPDPVLESRAAGIGPTLDRARASLSGSLR